jgi:hypothetical protein
MKKYYLDKRTFKSGGISILDLQNFLDLKQYIEEVVGVTDEVTETTSANFLDALTNGTLIPDTPYLINDYQTCYDQPNYDVIGAAIVTGNYKQGPIEPIIVRSMTNNSIYPYAWQAAHPNDIIKFDPTFTTTEITFSPAFGRITERIDEFGNRTDYDHAVIEFIRYRHIYHDDTNPLTGTVELQNDGTVLGTLTTFTSLTVGDVIAIPNSPGLYYEITLITDDFTMTVTSNTTIVATAPGEPFFLATVGDYNSHKQNLLDLGTLFQEYTTFGDSFLNINNYVGDYSLSHITDSIGEFLLANNVFRTGEFKGNTFGIACYNNTFNDDCTFNKIGDHFNNNITDDDFDQNVIGNYFENNVITANFNDNHIGNNFNNNTIICSLFYRNQIGNYFENNVITSNIDFQNNVVGNQFNGNLISGGDFYKNHIGHGYKDNNIYAENYGNNIGNGFNINNIYSFFYENAIGEVFSANTVGDPLNPGSYSFYNNRIFNYCQNNNFTGTCFNNTIDSSFYTNTLGNNFAYNKIGTDFQNNLIGIDFGFGGAAQQGNIIGNNFAGNTIGEYFYNNFIQDGFSGNDIADSFANNKISYDFSSNTSIGNNFKNNQTLISVSGVNFSLATHVYANYTCTVYVNASGDTRLSYVDIADVPQYGILVDA